MRGNKPLHIRLTPAEWRLIRSVNPDCVGQYISEKCRHMLLERAAELKGYKGLFKDIDGRVKVPEKVFKEIPTENAWPERGVC